MTVEDVLRKMGIQADVENTDVSSAKSIQSDIVVLSQELAGTLGDVDSKVVIVNNYFDEEEVERELSKVIK